LDDNGCNDGRYDIASLYYDSPDLRCYWEKEYGLKFRRKLRLRHYEADEPLTPESPIFLEIKQRVDRVTQKRRIILPYEQALRLCNDRQLPDAPLEEGDQAVLQEIFVYLWQYNLRPRSIVRYNRQAFIGGEYDLGLRITFDTTLSYQYHSLHLHEDPSGLLMLPPHLAIMEIKINERIPRWLTELIAAHNLTITRISKYCHSVESAQNMPVTSWPQPAPIDDWWTAVSPISILSGLKHKLTTNALWGGRPRQSSS
jgi:SPX domain protein involved in polyphosphate accumulation